MANLDTVSKRQSSVQIILYQMLAPQLPSGGFTQAARQQMAHVYAGILTLVTGTGAGYIRLERGIRGVLRGVGGR